MAEEYTLTFDQMRELQEQHEGYERELEQKEEEIVKLKLELESAFEEQEGFKAELQAKRDEMADVVSKLEAEVSAQSSKAKEDGQLISDLQEQNRVISQQLTALHQDLDLAFEHEQQLREENMRTEQGLLDEIQELKNEANATKKSRADIEADFKLEVCERTQKFKTELAQMTKEKDDQVDKLTRLQEQLEEALIAIDIQKAQLKEMEEDHALELSELKEAASAHVHELQGQIDNLEKKCHTQRSMEKQANSQISVLFSKIEDLKIKHRQEIDAEKAQTLIFKQMSTGRQPFLQGTDSEQNKLDFDDGTSNASSQPSLGQGDLVGDMDSRINMRALARISERVSFALDPEVPRQSSGTDRLSIPKPRLSLMSDMKQSGEDPLMAFTSREDDFASSRKRGNIFLKGSTDKCRLEINAEAFDKKRKLRKRSFAQDLTEIKQKILPPRTVPLDNFSLRDQLLEEAGADLGNIEMFAVSKEDFQQCLQLLREVVPILSETIGQALNHDTLQRFLNGSRARSVDCMDLARATALLHLLVIKTSQCLEASLREAHENTALMVKSLRAEHSKAIMNYDGRIAHLQDLVFSKQSELGALQNTITHLRKETGVLSGKLKACQAELDQAQEDHLVVKKDLLMQIGRLKAEIRD